MSKQAALAAVALTEAVKVGIDQTGNDYAKIVAGAELFYAFLTGGEAATGTPSAEPEKPKTDKPKTDKPKAEKSKPAPEPEKPKADDSLERVKGVIKSLIEADMREQVAQLLNAQGAKSASSLVEKGPEAVEAFLEAANELLLSA